MTVYVGNNDLFPTEKVTNNNFEVLPKIKSASSCIRALHAHVMFLNLNGNVYNAFFNERTKF